MMPRPERNAVRTFVENLETGARVIWIATGAKGTVQADKAILWDDGSLLSPKQNDGKPLGPDPPRAGMAARARRARHHAGLREDRLRAGSMAGCGLQEEAPQGSLPAARSEGIR